MLAFLPLEFAYRRLTHCFQPTSSLPTYPPSKLGHDGDFAGDSLTISWFGWPVASMCKCPLKGFLSYQGWTSPSIPPQVQGAYVLQSPVPTAIQALGYHSANSSPKAGPCSPVHQPSHTPSSCNWHNETPLPGPSQRQGPWNQSRKHDITQLLLRVSHCEVHRKLMFYHAR